MSDGVKSSTSEIHPLFTKTAIIASCVGFILIGALQALYGPAIPAMQEKFGITPAVAGISLSAHFAGALVGVMIFHRLLGRFSNKALLGGSYLLMAIGSLLFATASNWPLALFGAIVVGLGFGGIDYGLNQLFSIGFGRKSAAMLNLLNGNFGVGAIIGPVLIGVLGAQQYPLVFVAIAVVCVALLLTLGGVGARTRIEAPANPGETQSKVGRGPIIAAFIGVYVLHVAIETGVGGWEPSHLQILGYSAATAATATAAYWFALTVGRFVVVPFSLRWKASSILLVCCIGMAFFTLLATIPALAPWAYLGVGLMIAPIFPTCLPWLNRAVPSIKGAGAYVIAASMIGGVLFPPILGAALTGLGVGAVPLVLFALSLACAALAIWLRRKTPDSTEHLAVAPAASELSTKES